VHQEISRISNPQIQQQMTIPIALSHLLPAGVKGALCVILLMGVFGGDSTHLHSWGGLFIQDVLVPLRKKPFGPKQHVRLLRLSMAGVAVFAFIFGSLFQQTEYIMMWWSVTMAVFVGGAGSAIIGGLYWKKGTTAGAWAGLLAGSGLSLCGIIARQPLCGQALQWGNDWLSVSGFGTHRAMGFLLDHVGNKFPLNGVEISFFATLTAILLYAVVSLLTHKEDFNMDRMLHRGSYATVSPAGVENTQEVQPARRGWIKRLAGVDECFSLGDKWIAGLLFGWSMLWFTIFVTGSIWNLLAPWPESVWASYWHVVGIGIPIFFALITAVWFTWGGLRDMRVLFRRLREQKINHLDDGTVINHQNLDETALAPGPEQTPAKKIS
jgi:SSS family solute:Na+ symporter